jgi:hypothetical protein
MHQASCLCGSVIIQFDEVVGSYVYCHCRSCKKASGSAFGANISVPVSSFRVKSGAELISKYESSPGKVRHFCSRCGSPLYATVSGTPQTVRVRLGILDSDFSSSPSAHMFVKYKASWECILDSIPQYEEWPPPGSIKIHGSKTRARLTSPPTGRRVKRGGAAR